MRRPAFDDHFWSQVAKGDGCWEWQSSRLKSGGYAADGRGSTSRRPRYLEYSICGRRHGSTAVPRRNPMSNLLYVLLVIILVVVVLRLLGLL